MSARARLSAFSRPLVGFTLIELLVVVTVVAVLAVVAVPSFTQMIANNRVRSAANTLQASLLAARSEALKRNCAVTFRPREAAGWATGWEVVATSALCPNVTAPGQVLQEDRVDAVDVVSAPANLAALVYLPSGRVQGAGPAFYLRDPSAVAKRRCVVVELDGMTKVVEAGKHTRCPEPAP